MPSTSPGHHAAASGPRHFDQIFPGAPNATLQSFDSFVYRQKRYAAYISGSQLNVLAQPNQLVQALDFHHELVAIAAEEETGQLLVAGKRDLWVLRPHTEGWTRIWWEKALKLQREDAGDETSWLSWGNDEEALIGGSRVLSLFSTRPASRTSSSLGFRADGDTIEIRQPLWSKGTASPILFAEFSPSASIIASSSRYDRMVKLWRRLSFEEGLFDHTYLRHPGPVTHIQWRPHSGSIEERRNSGLSNRHDEDAEILFTVADDAVLRVWRTASMADVDIMVQYATIDLVSSIPQSPGLTFKDSPVASKPARFFFVLPAEQFRSVVHAAVGFLQDDTVNHSKEHLIEVASKDPDVIVSFDGHGRMSAWGLQSIGHKRRPETPTTPPIFHITHSEGVPFRISKKSPTVFKPWIHEDRLNFLVHTLDDFGRIDWWEGNVEALFSLSASGPERFALRSTWLGHGAPVLQLHSSHQQLVSRSSKDAQTWALNEAESTAIESRLEVDSDVVDVIQVGEGKVLVVTNSKVSLCLETGRELANALQNSCADTVICTTHSNGTDAYGYLYPGRGGAVFAWAVRNADLELTEIAALEDVADVKFLIPVASSGSPGHCFVACTKDGMLHCFSSQPGKNFTGKAKRQFDAGVSDPVIFTATQWFAAMVSANSREVRVLDLSHGYVEYRQQFQRQIQDVKALSHQSGANFLATAFPETIQIMSQGRYAGPVTSDSMWTIMKSVSIPDVGLQIRALVWLHDDDALAAAAGNGVFVSDGRVNAHELGPEIRETLNFDVETKTQLKMRHLADFTRNPLPVWHPEQLSYMVLHGKAASATALLKKLGQALKFWTSGDYLDPLLGTYTIDTEEAFEIDAETAHDLKEQLEEHHLPRLSTADQEQLKRVIDALVYLKEHANGLDQNALRYLFEWKLQLLEERARTSTGLGDDRTKPQSDEQPFVPCMRWREIAFARQSSTQQPLLDVLTLHYDNKVTWRIARYLGIVSWLSDREALEQVFEQLAQTAYRSQQPADPVDASLYFLALQKKPTLIALWRIATWHKEQRSTMNFLKRDFSQADAKTAAKKNAYALMGKRRFEYCAAFFLLADDPASAISVLAGQCEDLSLAIAVARLYAGDGSAALRKLLEDRVIPQAKQEGNRWLLSWCHTVLYEKDEAAESLVNDLEGVKTWKQDEPSTLLLYQQLKRAPSDSEYAAILRSAAILRRMGLWLLALDMVSQWKFTTPLPAAAAAAAGSLPVATAMTNGFHENATFQEKSIAASAPPSLLDDFSPPTNSAPAVVDEKAAREAKAAELLKKLKAKKDGQQPTTDGEKTAVRAPTQFKEPDANSLLDSFGF